MKKETLLAIALALALVPPALARQRDPVRGLVFFGDMAVDRDSIEGILQDGGGPTAQGAVKLDLEPWEDGILPLVFDRHFGKDRKEMLFAACEEWSGAANVRCIEGAYKGRKLKVGRITSGCWSLYGMGRYLVVLKRRMNLASECWERSTLLHELGHAFGLIHEHQRPDRDRYVRVERRNIRGSLLGLLYKVNFDELGAEARTPYDFHSIMHYGRRAASKNRKDTIVPLSPNEHMIDVIGRQERISPLDAETLAAIYGPPSVASSP